MIKIHVTIKERPAGPGKIAGMLEAEVNSQNPTPEEISVAARVMFKLRDIATDIQEEFEADISVLERIVDVRHLKPKSDRHPDGDSGSGPSEGSPEGEGGGGSPPKE